MDTKALDEARAHAEGIEAEAHQMVAEAHAAYGRAMADLVDEHGATTVAKALGLSRGRVYQIMRKADGAE